ncbi:MAG: hypothetical protein JST81_00890 [Bacteroidetes bacterium]|nr:hypothetical protein [Bacteroidota bacterium]
MKKILPVFLLLIMHLSSFTQQITAVDYKKLQKGEDTLKVHAWKIITGMNSIDRLKADSIFTRGFVKNLKTANSFYYPFDSLETISKLYAPDSSFRIYTWQLVVNDRVYRQHGAIQIRTKDGSLKLIPLIDKSDVTQNLADTIGNNNGWIGAVYYKIVLTQFNGQKFYTLMGFDGNSISSDRKIIEVLHFENEEPIFGGPFFSIPSDGLKPHNPARYIIEFKKDAVPRLTYDNELQMIIVEHLVSESNQPAKKYTLVGDGDYDGFKWVNNKWVHVDRVFSGTVTPEGQPPIPVPLDKNHGIETDDNGKGKVNEAPVKKKD